MKALLSCILATVFFISLYSQNNPLTIDSTKWMGVTLQSGIRFKDHKALSQLLYGDENKLGTGIYYSGALEMRFAFNRIYAMVGIQPTFFEKEISESEHLEIQDDYGYFSIGYVIRPASRLEILPNVGLSYGHSQISHSRDTTASTSVQDQLSSNADTYKLITTRAYVRYGLAVTYQIHWSEATLARGFFPVEIGLNADYQQAIDSSRWQNALRKNIDGPDVFPNSFYVGFVMGWWF